ncbi:MAG: metallophosphoesterase family protein [Polyangiales bacterium]
MQHPERIVTARAEYQRVAALSLSRWLIEPIAPTLCFSDTHFVPQITGWNDDAPEDLCALLDALREHEPWSLGDLCEWVGLAPARRAELFVSERLRPLWTRLRARRARVVVGNHDYGSAEVLRAQFGGDRVFDGGFSLGAVRVRHGHERSRLETLSVAAIGPVAVPVYEALRKLARRPAERLPNALVLRALDEREGCVLFGHTHSLGWSLDGARRWINPGCFLRSAQSFAVIEGTTLALYRREGSSR